MIKEYLTNVTVYFPVVHFRSGHRGHRSHFGVRQQKTVMQMFSSRKCQCGLTGESTLAKELAWRPSLSSQRQMFGPSSAIRSLHNENSWGQGQAHTLCTYMDTLSFGLSWFGMKAHFWYKTRRTTGKVKKNVHDLQATGWPSNTHQCPEGMGEGKCVCDSCPLFLNGWWINIDLYLFTTPFLGCRGINCNYVVMFLPNSAAFLVYFTSIGTYIECFQKYLVEK